jgi:nicotinamidase-related amidase
MANENAKSAFLTLDLQAGLLSMIPGAESVLPKAAEAVEAARRAGFFIIHVGLGFNEGYPEIGPPDSPMQRVKQNNVFVIGTPSAAISPAVYRPGELVVYKQRFGAFSENNLRMILRARGIERLALCGVVTSGVVLSTVRRAFDLDYRLTVVKDGCIDRDPEVHRVLIEKVFPAQAKVVSAEEFAASPI